MSNGSDHHPETKSLSRHGEEILGWVPRGLNKGDPPAPTTRWKGHSKSSKIIDDCFLFYSNLSNRNSHREGGLARWMADPDRALGAERRGLCAATPLKSCCRWAGADAATCGSGQRDLLWMKFAPGGG